MFELTEESEELSVAVSGPFMVDLLMLVVEVEEPTNSLVDEEILVVKLSDLDVSVGFSEVTDVFAELGPIVKVDLWVE